LFGRFGGFEGSKNNFVFEVWKACAGICRNGIPTLLAYLFKIASRNKQTIPGASETKF